MRAGTLSPTAARQHPWRNVVTRALSGGRRPGSGRDRSRRQAGERYLLCSDGLFTVVGRRADRADARRPEQLARSDLRALMDAANEAGGPDNITTLVLQVDVP